MAKRFVKEFGNFVKESCLEYPDKHPEMQRKVTAPLKVIREIDRTVSYYERNLITEFEAVKEILIAWENKEFV